MLMADYDDASKKSGVRRVSVADGTFVSNGVAPDGMLNGLSMSPDGRQLAVESGVAKTESWVLENFLRGVNYYCRAADNCRRALPAEAGRRARCEGQVAHTRRPVIRNCHLAGVGRWQFLPR